MKTAVFLDRDNTIIENDGDLGDASQVRLIRGAASAIASLRGLGFKVVVVTNQGGVARGRFTENDVHAVNHRINQLVNANADVLIDRFYYCPYHPDAVVEQYRQEHPWRKPNPGMLVEAATDLELDLSQSWMIGDQPRDVEAGLAAGARTILLDPQVEHWAPAAQGPDDDAAGGAGTVDQAVVAPHFVAKNLIEAVKVIVGHRSPELTIAVPRKAALEVVVPLRKAPDTARSPRAAPPDTEAEARESHDDAQWEDASDTAELVAEPIEADLPAGEVEPEPPEPTPPAQDRSSPQVLRQILQELRFQRGQRSDFSYLTVMAIVMQMLALICLLAAFWMGGSNQELFIRWLGTAHLTQLAAIALLIFQRHA